MTVRSRLAWARSRAGSPGAGRPWVAAAMLPVHSLISRPSASRSVPGSDVERDQPGGRRRRRGDPGLVGAEGADGAGSTVGPAPPRLAVVRGEAGAGHAAGHQPQAAGPRVPEQARGGSARGSWVTGCCSSDGGGRPHGTSPSNAGRPRGVLAVVLVTRCRSRARFRATTTAAQGSHA